MMIRGFLVGACLAVAASGGALAQGFPNPFDGTPEDKAACRPDVMRYCKPALPDQFQVLACLQSVRAKLAPQCKQVLAKYGQ